jgi:hypothetical protein
VALITTVRIIVFFKNPKHWMPIVGAFIVFMTFIVKEGLREHWKDTADAIDLAEYIYGIRADTTAIKKEQETEEEVRFLESVKRAKIKFDNYQPLVVATGHNSAILRHTQTTLAGLDILTDTLPVTDANRLLSTKFHSAAVALDARINAAYKKIEEARDARRRNEKPPHMSNAIYEELIEPVGTLDYNVQKLQQDVLDDAEKTRQTNRRRSEWAWWISSGLYALGWGLSLVGKLYGVPEAAGGD